MRLMKTVIRLDLAQDLANQLKVKWSIDYGD